jgi:hypothetical protein
MPPKNSPIKAATTTPKHQNTPSPPRKTNTKRESSNFVQKLLNADQVKYKTVGIPGLAIGLILKSDGVGPAYVGKILGFVENNAEKMDRCKLLLVTQLRNPNGMNIILQTPNKKGNEYPHDIVVFSLDPDGEITINQAVTEFAKVITEIAKNDCKDDWKYGTPFFSNKGDATPPDVQPLGYYLMDEDCVTVIKRTYEGCDTKDELMNNEFRDDILKAVFGDANKGFSAVEAIADEVYYEL